MTAAPVEQWYACLGESVLEHLKREHSRYDDNGTTRDRMLALFGFPKACLVCAKPLLWENRDDVPNDVDPWFCSGCCPICHDPSEPE